jgi:23S rRNA (guanosine2251-2'-O)-methyltransferase
MEHEKRIHLIPGFHNVKENLEHDPANLVEIWISRGGKTGRTQEILTLAEKHGIPVLYKNREILDHILPGMAHQGIVALSREFGYTDLADLIRPLRESGDQGLLVAADHITDEGNLGAIIRTSAFFGARGLILPKNRSAAMTRNVIKRSSGAFVHLPVARVVNLSRALDTLDKNGFWIMGAAGDGDKTLYEFDWRGNVVLVLGSEDRGLGREVRKRCHQLIRIPSSGYIQALNVSVACGIILSEIVRQRTAM